MSLEALQQTGPKHATVERKYIWKQMLSMLDPFTIAAASILSHRVRTWCVSKDGLLKVPCLILNYAASHADMRVIHALPAIEKAELVEFELWNNGCDNVWGNEEIHLRETDEPTSHEHFSVCLGWLFGAFPKLRRVAIIGLRNRLQLVPLLRSLRRCPALEELSLQDADFEDVAMCAAFEVVQALPAFRGLCILHLAVRPAFDGSDIDPESQTLTALAACSVSLPSLHTLCLCLSSREAARPGFVAALQRCIDVFHLRQLSLAGDRYLSERLSAVTWPFKCRLLSLAVPLDGRSLSMLATSVCQNQVEGLTLLSPAEGLEAPELREFLTILATSTLQSFTWSFCGLYISGLQSESRIAVSEGLGHLISFCPSLKKLVVFHDERYLEQSPWPELAILANMATQHGVCFQSPQAQLRKHVRLRQVWLRPSVGHSL
ncbi:unnamed protein product [Symbiodinium sp. CCMP2592]|nr:unnamed protein product [Symbiodinium sp. CCMP2592]